MSGDADNGRYSNTLDESVQWTDFPFGPRFQKRGFNVRPSVEDHVSGIDSRHRHWLLHGIASERLAELLVQHNFDECRDTIIHLFLDSRVERFVEGFSAIHLDTLESTGIGNLGVFDLQLSSVPTKLSSNHKVVLRFSAPH